MKGVNTLKNSPCFVRTEPGGNTHLSSKADHIIPCSLSNCCAN
ncbi:Uncharacterised protein [Vibrio cholerae]|nr:Uncharacterised protein [Vibrio cholerae]